MIIRFLPPSWFQFKYDFLVCAERSPFLSTFGVDFFPSFRGQVPTPEIQITHSHTTWGLVIVNIDSLKKGEGAPR